MARRKKTSRIYTMSSNSRSRPAVSHMPSVESREVEKDQILDIVKLDSQNVLIVGHTGLYTMEVAAKFQRIQNFYCYEDNFNGLKMKCLSPLCRLNTILLIE
jgi:hypothetical protein